MSISNLASIMMTNQQANIEKQNFSLKKLFFQIFDIKETTSKGKKWVRVQNEETIRWV